MNSFETFAGFLGIAVEARVVLTCKEQLDNVPSLVIHVFDSRFSLGSEWYQMKSTWNGFHLPLTWVYSLYLKMFGRTSPVPENIFYKGYGKILSETCHHQAELLQRAMHQHFCHSACSQDNLFLERESNAWNSWSRYERRPPSRDQDHLLKVLDHWPPPTHSFGQI